MYKIKLLVISIVMSLSFSVFSQDVLTKPKENKEQNFPKAKSFPRLEEDTLHFEKAQFVDVKSGLDKFRNVKFTILINGNYMDVITKIDTTTLNFIGPIKDVKIRNIDNMMIKTDSKEMVFIPYHKEFIVFTSDKYITKLFNNDKYKINEKKNGE